MPPKTVAAAAFFPGVTGISLCEISEPGTNLLAIAFLLMCFVGLVYLAIRLRRSHRDSPAVPQAQESTVCVCTITGDRCRFPSEGRGNSYCARCTAHTCACACASCDPSSGSEMWGPDKRTRARHSAIWGESQAMAKASTSPPLMIHFTNRATDRKRSYHTKEHCSALSRASTVCSAELCKLCARGTQ